MAKMTEAQIAVTLERLRSEFPSEVSQIETHLEEMGSTDAFHQLIREVADALASSNLTVAAVQPVLDRGVVAMEAMVVEEKRRNDLEEKRQDQDYEIKITRLQKIIVPLVSAGGGGIITLLLQWITNSINTTG